MRLDAGDGAVSVRSARLALGWLKPGGLQPLPLSADGWRRSGGACLAWRIPSGDNAWWPCPELKAVQAPMPGGWLSSLLSGAGKL
ncbi:MAG: hypothetical protein WCH37_06940 [Synechococcaceae cyanobacterium ELA182]